MRICKLAEDICYVPGPFSILNNEGPWDEGLRMILGTFLAGLVCYLRRFTNDGECVLQTGGHPIPVHNM
jgi:hypothetical protein